MEYQWLFVCLWGYLGLAAIHLVDAITEYRARRCSYKEGRFQKTFKNKRFLWPVSGIEWDGHRLPPPVAVATLLLPGILACVAYWSLHQFGFPISDAWEAAAVVLLVVLASYSACWLYHDFSSHVYLISGGCFVLFALLRFALLDGIKQIGMGFDSLLAALIVMYGLFLTIFIPLLGKKFPWKSKYETIRIINRGNVLQMVLVTVWSLILFYGMFYGLE